MNDTIPIAIGQYSLQGGRTENQDAHGVERLSNGWQLAIVCDGMGGHQGGKFAANLAVREIIQYCQQHFAQNEPLSLLERAIRQANFSIFHAANTNQALRGMGTTVTALIVTPKEAFVANVGDSRTFQIRNKTCLFKTKDDSHVYNWMLSGQLTEEDARVHPKANHLTKALGVANVVEPSFQTLSWQWGDLFFLCTDGVWSLLPHEQLIAQIVAAKKPNAMTINLLTQLDQSARAQPDYDNLTAIALQMGDGSRLKYLFSALSRRQIGVMSSLLLFLVGCLWVVRTDFFKHWLSQQDPQVAQLQRQLNALKAKQSDKTQIIALEDSIQALKKRLYHRPIALTEPAHGGGVVRVSKTPAPATPAAAHEVPQATPVAPVSPRQVIEPLDTIAARKLNPLTTEESNKILNKNPIPKL
jgi:PPM family protein phosphatase